MGIFKYIMTGSPFGNDIDNYEREKEKFNKNLTQFLKDRRTIEILKEYNFDVNKLKDIIERNHRLGIYNIVSILKKSKLFGILLDIYTKAPDDWTEEDRFIQANNFLNQYNIYK